MRIIGDLKYATKFCVDTQDKGILWVGSYETAEQYVNNPNKKDWYGQTVIATHEQIVKGEDGKCYLKSKAPVRIVTDETIDNLATFKEQSYKKLKRDLEAYAYKKGFDSFLELISFSNSGIKSYKALAKEGLKYRDLIYSYTDEFFSKLDESTVNSAKDISNLYDDYLKNFPFM